MKISKIVDWKIKMDIKIFNVRAPSQNEKKKKIILLTDSKITLNQPKHNKEKIIPKEHNFLLSISHCKESPITKIRSACVIHKPSRAVQNLFA